MRGDSSDTDESNGRSETATKRQFWYDPKETSLICVFFRYSSTVLPHVVRRFEFWMFLACHLAVYASYSMGYLDVPPENGTWSVSYTNLKVITMMTTFFEVFYTNQCYTRYLSIYRITRHMLRKLPEFILDLRVNVPDPQYRCYIRLASRYLMASLFLCFVEFTKDGEALDEKDWQELQRKGLLRPAEVALLRRFDGDRTTRGSAKHLVLLHWTGTVTREVHVKSKAIANTFKDMFGRLTAILEMQQDLVDTMELPVPYQYFHLLNMMVVVNLMLWAYAMGISASLWAPVTFLFAEIIFMGMLELASQLADPFGEDEVDFPVREWTLDYLRFTSVFIEQQFPLAADGWEASTRLEKRLRVKDFTFGGEWEEPLPSETRRAGPGANRGYDYTLLRTDEERGVAGSPAR